VGLLGHDLARSTKTRDLPAKPGSTGGPCEQTAATVAHAKKMVEAHIRLLTRYNATRDVARGLLGMIAEGEGRALGDVMRERGLVPEGE